MKNCIDCNMAKEESLFNRTLGGFRPECKVCEKGRREARKLADPIKHAANTMAQGILKRTKYAINDPKNATYKHHGIVSEIGDNTADIRRVLITHFREDIKRLLDEGRTPSIDRIDSRGNYTMKNLQAISVEENSSKADLSSVMRTVIVEFETGDEKHFESVVAASNYLKCKRDTIYASHEGNRRTRKGWKARIS